MRETTPGLSSVGGGVAVRTANQEPPNHSCVCSTNQSRGVTVGKADENEHSKDHHGDPERGLLPVPFL